MGNLGLQELVVMFAIALLVVGPKRLPELGRAIGEALRAFQDAMKEPPSDASGPHPPQRPD